MKAKIARWGNSLAVRLPAEVVRDYGLREGQLVELSPKDAGKLEIETERPVVNGVPVYSIEELVAEMDRLGPANRPDFVDWGSDVGAEVIDDAYSRDSRAAEGRRPGVGGSAADEGEGAVRRPPRRRPDRS